MNQVFTGGEHPSGMTENDALSQLPPAERLDLLVFDCELRRCYSR
jgi:hypothetical protein